MSRAGGRPHRDPETRIIIMQYYTYMLASKRNGTMYVGVASNLIARVLAHKQNVVKGFTSKYGVHRLVWYECHCSKEAALIREKRIKKWKRAWKLELIEKGNPSWQELYDQIA